MASGYIPGIDNVLAGILSARGISFRRSSRNLDKSELVTCHNEAAEEFSRLVDEYAFQKDARPLGYVTMDPPRPAAPFSCLNKASLRELKRNLDGFQRLDEGCSAVSTGLYAVGTLCVKPFLTGGVRTVFEDEEGSAVLVVIDNAVVPAASREDVCQKYPQGMKVAIKEPMFRQLWDDGTLGVKISNPADIVPLPAGQRDYAQLLDRFAVDLKESRCDVFMGCLEELCARGNVHLARKSWSRAAACYKKSARLLDLCKHVRAWPWNEEINTEEAAGSNAGSFCDEKLAMVYSKMCDALFRLGSYKQALRSAEMVLELNPTDVETSLRKAGCLHRMHKYEEAVALLESLQESSASSDPEVLIRIARDKRRAEIGARQNGSGDYQFKHEGCMEDCHGSEDAPECAPFVGAIEIRASRESGRRGMFATRDLKPGELLLVSKPLAEGEEPVTWPARALIFHGRHLKCLTWEEPQAHPDSEDTPNVEVPWGKWNAQLQAIVVQMIARALASPQYAAQLRSLQNGNQGRLDVPPFSLFTEDWDDEKYGAVNEDYISQLDVRDIRRIVEANAFAGAIYGLPSFFNHSCIPNCTHRIFQGKMMFISCTRPVQAGEELFITYFTIFESLASRKSHYSMSPFQCDCARCKFEEEALQRIPALAALAQTYHADFESGRRTSSTTARACQVAGVLEAILRSKACAGFTQERKDWIRCSFAQVYVLSFNCFGEQFMDKTVRILNSVYPGSPSILALLALGIDEHYALDRRARRHVEQLLRASCQNVYMPVKEKRFDTLVDVGIAHIPNFCRDFTQW